MREMPPDSTVVLSKPKRAKKERPEPVIGKDDPEAGVKKAMFGRIARKAVEQKQASAERKMVEAGWARNARLISAEAKLQEVNAQIVELTSAIFGAASKGTGKMQSIEEIREKIADGTENNSVVEAMMSMLDVLDLDRAAATKALLEAQEAVEKKPALEKMRGSEREHTLQNAEREMRETLERERHFETLLGGMSEASRSGWANSVFEGFVPYIEQRYLKPGAIAEQVLRQFVDDPESLSPTLRKSAEETVEKVFSQYIDTKIREIPLKNDALRDQLAAKIRETENTPAKRAEVFAAYLADPSPKKLSVNLVSPEAAQIAVREIVLQQGKASIDEMHTVLATFAVADSNISNSHLPKYFTDEERSIVVDARDGYPSQRVVRESERAVLERFGVKYNAPSPMIQEARGKLLDAQEYSVKMADAEKAVDRAIAKDWITEAQKKVDERIAQRVQNVKKQLDDVESDARRTKSAVMHFAGGVAEAIARIHLMSQGEEEDFHVEDWTDRLNEVYSSAAALNKRKVDARSFDGRIFHAVSSEESGIAQRVQYDVEDAYKQWVDNVSGALHGRLPTQDVWKVSNILSKQQIDSRRQKLSERVLDTKADANNRVWKQADSMKERATEVFHDQISPLVRSMKELAAEIDPLIDGALNALRTEMLPEAREYLATVLKKAEAAVKVSEKAKNNADEELERATAKQQELEKGFFSAFKKGAITKAVEDVEKAKLKCKDATRMFAKAKEHRNNVHAVHSRLAGDAILG